MGDRIGKATCKIQESQARPIRPLSRPACLRMSNASVKYFSAPSSKTATISLSYRQRTALRDNRCVSDCCLMRQSLRNDCERLCTSCCSSTETLPSLWSLDTGYFTASQDHLRFRPVLWVKHSHGRAHRLGSALQLAIGYWMNPSRV